MSTFCLYSRLEELQIIVKSHYLDIFSTMQDGYINYIWDYWLFSAQIPSIYMLD